MKYRILRIWIVVFFFILAIVLLRQNINFLTYNSIFTSKYRTLLLVPSVIFFILRFKKPKSPELMPSVANSDKDNNNEKQVSDISFNDVAGLDEIKDELKETIDFINNLEKYKKMGAKIPKGVLFYGPPGTGKTLLAKAVAGETNSTFLYASGSEFVEKYVGVGAKRVRTLFEKAKKDAPSIIFIDEIDAIGAKRNFDSNNEKDQTLNQLLVELDGYNSSDTVVVIGATNRLDLLDEALLRPGRFDRHIFVGNPNAKSREEILKVHTKNKPLEENIVIGNIAKRTHGLSGAQLANIANEAAIIAVRNNKQIISLSDFEAAIERVLAGLEIRNHKVVEKEKKTVAIHEAGHALVSKYLDIDLVQKISIIPRGHALGYVLKFPEEDRYLLTKKELYNKISGLLAGRAAEELIINEITTGAKDDLDKATKLAKEMVCSYGMSPLGQMYLDENIIKLNSNEIRIEIQNILDSCYKTSLKILKENVDLLNHISYTLRKNETIDSEELDEIFNSYKSKIDCVT